MKSTLYETAPPLSEAVTMIFPSGEEMLWIPAHAEAGAAASMSHAAIDLNEMLTDIFSAI